MVARFHRHDVTGLVVDDHRGGLELLGGIGLGDVLDVLINLVHLGLDLGIHRRIDAEAAGGDHLVGRLVGDALERRQIAADVPDDGVLEVGVIALLLHVELVLMPALGAGVIVAVGLEAVDLVLEAALGAGVLLIARGALELQDLVADPVIFVAGLDIALLKHLLQDGQRAVLVVLGVDIGVVAGGVVGDADDAGALLGGQLVQLLAEIDVGGALDAVGALSQIDRVEIPGDDLFLGVVLLEVQRLEDLHELAADRHVLLAGQVLDELLGQGGAAVGGAADEHVGGGGQGAHPVHAVVLPEALVLDGDGGVDHVRRDLLIIHPDPVFHRQQLADLLVISIGVFRQNEGGLIQPNAVQIVMGNGDDILFNIGFSFFIDPHSGYAPGDAQKNTDSQQRRDHPPEHVDHSAGDGALARIRSFFPFNGLFFIHNFPSIAAEPRRYEKRRFLLLGANVQNVILYYTP